MKAVRLYLSKKLIQLGNWVAKDLASEMKLKQSTIEFIRNRAKVLIKKDEKNKRNN